MRILILIALGACSQRAAAPAAPAPATPASAPTVAAGAFAPQLFDVDQLRAGNPRGRIIELRMEVDGKAPVTEHWEFTAVDANQATIRSITRDASGKVLADASGSSTWDELDKHGRFPADVTTIEDNVSVTVPAGTFDTRLYTITQPPSRRRLWFATDLPGPPVLMIFEKDGKVTLRAEMLRAR